MATSTLTWTLTGDTTSMATVLKASTPRPAPPDQIKTPVDRFGIPETENPMTLEQLGALCGIVALVLVLIILL
jgi:hypothetical protein